MTKNEHLHKGRKMSDADSLIFLFAKIKMENQFSF